jgi:hypothetical protein
VPDLFDGDWVSADSLKLIERPTSRMGFLEKVVAYARMISSFIWVSARWRVVKDGGRHAAKQTGLTRVG